MLLWNIRVDSKTFCSMPDLSCIEMFLPRGPQAIGKHVYALNEYDSFYDY